MYLMLRKFFIDRFTGEETDKPYTASTYYSSNPEGVSFTFYLNPVVGGITLKQLQSGNVGVAGCNFNLFGG